jgi:hypothetical protein
MKMVAGQRIITDDVVSQSLTTHHLIGIKHYSKLILPVTTHAPANLPLIVLYHASV